MPRSSSEAADIQRAVIAPFFDKAAYLASHPGADSDRALDDYLGQGWKSEGSRRDFNDQEHARKHLHIQSPDVTPLFHHVVTSAIRGQAPVPTDSILYHLLTGDNRTESLWSSAGSSPSGERSWTHESLTETNALLRHVQDRAVLLLSHGLGGGVESHVVDLATRLEAANVPAIIVRAGRGTRTGMDVALVAHGFRTQFLEFDTGTQNKIGMRLARLLEDVRPMLVHVHSVAGLKWTEIQNVFGLLETADRPYGVTLHDYSSVCHRNHLLTPAGICCWVGTVDVCRKCAVCDGSIHEIDPGARRNRFGKFLSQAKAVFAPSIDTQRRIRSVFPKLEVVVRPHLENDIEALEASREDHSRRQVALLGFLHEAKGGRLLCDLAGDAKARDLPLDFTVVGHSTYTSELRELSVQETGRYASDSEALKHLARLRPDLIFLPSIVPETYSYALTLALRSGVPPVVFDTGAMAERLRALRRGHILDAAGAFNPTSVNDSLLCLDLDRVWKKEKMRIKLTAHISDYYKLLLASELFDTKSL